MRSTRSVLVLAALVPALVVGVFAARAQEANPQVFTFEDREVEDAFERARMLEQQGTFAAAGEEYAKLETLLEKKREKDPDQRIVLKVSPDVDRGVALVLRERIRALPEDGLKAYRTLVEPRAKVALEEALETEDRDALEAVAERFALSQSAERAVALTGDLALERGDMARALRAYARLERQGDAQVAKQAAFARFCAAVGLGDMAGAADALASFEAKGGDPAAPRIPLEGKVVSAKEALERARAKAATPRSDKAVDPGRLVRSIALDAPELPVELAERLERTGGVVPAFIQPVYDAETGFLLVADEKALRAVDLTGARRGWTYSPKRDDGEPGRLEVATITPALSQGRVFATLHYNRPAKRMKKAGGLPGIPGVPQQPPKKKPPGNNNNKKDKNAPADDEEELVRQPDWRVVALERKGGRLLWDAAESARFEDFSRDAEWVSSPSVADGQVFVSVLTRKGSDLRCYLVALDAQSGKVRFRAFLASRLPFDFLGVGSPPAAPAFKDGRVYVTTQIGVVACVDATRGDVAWLARYPTMPERTQPEAVRGDRRFKPTSPLVKGRHVVVAPADAQELYAFDALTGARRWSAPRGEAHVVAETLSGDILLVKDRVLALDRQGGATIFRGEAFGGDALAVPAVTEKEAVFPTPTALVRVSLEDGRVLSRFRFEKGAHEAGAIAACDEGRLATASFSTANLYEDGTLVVPAAKSMERAQGALMLGESYARMGNVEQAVRELERAIGSGLSAESTTRARKLAFAACAEQATRLRAKPDRDGFLAAAARALSHSDKALEEAHRSPNREPELEQRAATLRRLLADTHSDGKTVQEWAKAVEAYQRLLLTPAGTLVGIDAGLAVDARAYATRRLRELVKVHGRECYGLEDRSASEHLKTAQRTGTKEGFEKVVDLYPASAYFGEALWGLHRHYLERRLESKATETLERFLADVPDDALAPDAMARLAQLYERLNRPARARAFAAKLLALGDTVRVKGLEDGTERNATEVAKKILARTAVGDPDALARQDAASDVEAPLRRVFRSTTELSANGAELVEPRNAALGPRDRYVVRRVSTIEERSTETGVVIAQVDAPQGLAPERRWLGWCAGALLVPSATHLMAHDPATGKLLWQLAPTPRTGRPAISPDDLHAVEYGDEVALVLTRWNELVGVDGKTGRARWTRALNGRDAGGGLLARGKLGVVISDQPAKLEAIDLDTGMTAWTWTPAAKPGVVARAGITRWVGASSIACILDGRRLAFIDSKDGSLRWTATSGEGGWFGEPLGNAFGDALVVRGMGGGPAFWVYDAKTGKERWRDDGYGAVLPGPRPETDGVLPLLEEVIAGETAVYTFRQRAGATEVWSQSLENGTKNWQWEAHGVRGPTAIVETPTAIVCARDGRFDRASLVVLGKGTGKVDEQIPLPGRKLIGRGLVAAGGCVVVSTDRGTFGLTHVDDERLARETLAATLDFAASDTPRNRAALADKLVRANPPRVEDALDSVSKALLAEGAGASPETYDRLFAQLASLAESAVEQTRPHYDVRRMPRPPEVDGELNDWWRSWSSIDMTGPRYVCPIQLEGGRPGRWNGPEDLSAKLYMGWDERYFYFALDVLDTDLRPYDSESPKWIGDCLLMAIDTKNDGGYWFAPDDMLLSLALTLPKKKKDDDKDKDKKDQDEDEASKKPEGKYFVKRKEDGSGAVYEARIPWATFKQYGTTGEGAAGFTFGFNVILTDDDGDRFGPQDLPPGVDPKNLPEGHREGDFRGSLKSLQLTPSVLLHEKKERLWQGYIPEYFAKITLK